MPPKYDSEYEPRLADHGGDMSKRWYIDFKIWDTDKQVFVRKQYTGMNKFKTLLARRKASIQKLSELNELLEKGYTVGKRKITVKAYDIRSLTLKQAFNYFINIKNASESSKFELNETYNPKGAAVSKGTFKNYRTIRSILFDWLSENNIAAIRFLEVDASTANSFFDYLKQDKGLQNKTFNNYLGDMRGMFNFYIQREGELTIRNPFLKVAKKKVKNSNKHVPFTNEQLKSLKEKMLEAGERQLYLFVNFIYYTFARPGREVRLMQIKDIREKTIFIPDERAKTNGEHIDIAPGLKRLIDEFELRKYPPNYYVFTAAGHPGDQPVGINHFYKRHTKLLKELAFTDKDYSLYGYKHTGAINLYLATKDIKLVQKHCRHASSNQTDEYLRDLGIIRNGDIENSFPDF